jgi:hypothetical protein
MRKPGSVQRLEELGRVRLSESFFMRGLLYSEVANFYGVPWCSWGQKATGTLQTSQNIPSLGGVAAGRGG